MEDRISTEQMIRLPFARLVWGSFYFGAAIWAGSCIYSAVSDSINLSRQMAIENYESFQVLRNSGASEEVLREHFPDYDSLMEHAASTQPS